ncbi:hypothetical protein P7C70_g2310, partial [Phenoliferia sp. Uapishka_3]
MDAARRLLALDDDSLDFIPQEVDSRKLQNFHANAPKKSRHEKDKEAAAKKAREEEEEAAKAYEEFVEAFGVEEEGPTAGGSGGGRGGASTRGGTRTAGKGFVRAGGGGYNPLKDMESRTPPTPPIPTGPRSTRPSAMSMMDDDESDNSCLDSILSTYDDSRDQKEREDRLQYQAGRAGSSVTALAAREQAPALSGSYDTGDPQTTNIHVSNLPQNVTEQSLGMLFARYGPVGSVKIMWPRLDGPPIPGGRRILGGFVAYLRRVDAVAASKELDGFEWGGAVLRTGWGKSVPLPSRPIYGTSHSLSRFKFKRSPFFFRSSPLTVTEIEGVSSTSINRPPSSRQRQQRRDSSPDERRKRRRSSYSSDEGRSRSPPRRNWPKLEEGVEEKFLRTVADKVKEHGSNFEGVIREREKGNAKFGFFRDEKLPSFHFFKMLLDSTYKPPTVSTFLDEGNADTYSSDSAEDSENEHMRKGRLGKLAFRRFESMLRGLVSTREKIARGMAFALEHADAAELIVDVLVASLTLDATPVPRKIARLHLVSDILHNSASLPHAWVYRATLESRLTEVFDHLGDVYLSFPGRMKAEQFKMQVTKIVDVWERDWFVFEPKVIDDFKRRLSGETVVVASAPSYSPPVPSSVTSTSFSTAEVPPPPPPPAAAPSGFRPTGFKAASFATSSFQPSMLSEAIPDKITEDTVDGVGEEVDGDEVDLDGEDVDVDGDAVEVDVDGEVVEEQQEEGRKEGEGRKVEMIEIDGEDEMDIGGDSDEDMF